MFDILELGFEVCLELGLKVFFCIQMIHVGDKALFYLLSVCLFPIGFCVLRVYFKVGWILTLI